MSDLTTSWIVFAFVFGGALLGMFLRTILPEGHLSADSKTVVNLGMGLLATIAAVVLGLLISSAQNSFSTQQSEFRQLCANTILLDRILAHYGPETKEARDLLRHAMVHVLNETWPQDSSGPEQLRAPGVRADAFYDKIQALEPQNDAQRALQTQAISLVSDLRQTRWLMFEQQGGSIPMPFLVVLVFWLAMIFVSFGLYASPNATVITTLCVCALSIAGAIFLILELDQPFSGWIQIPSTPLRSALTQLGQ